MSIIYGNYPLDINEAEYQVVLKHVQEIAIQRIGMSFTGIPIVTLDDFHACQNSGYALIGDATKTNIIGVCYRDQELSRVWITRIISGKYTLFVDGQPALIEKLGLNYDPITKNVTSDVLGSRVLCQSLK